MRHHGYVDNDQVPHLYYKHVLKKYTVNLLEEKKESKLEDKFITKDN